MAYNRFSKISNKYIWGMLIAIFFTIVQNELVICAEYYIDFEHGNDHNPGSREHPWQHHPWDINAGGNAKQTSGVHTYYFKKGVIYRGSLKADESGMPEKSIVLSVDPSWGEGEALIYGSERIPKGWEKCTDAECSEIPNASRAHTWYHDSDNSYVPRLLFELRGDRVRRLQIARSPNWTITDPEDPRKEWWEWTQGTTEVTVWVEDASRFNTGDRIYFGDKPDFKKRLRQKSQPEFNHVLKKGKDWLLLAIMDWQDLRLEAGMKISNGAFHTTIKKIAGSHDIRVRMRDTNHLSQNDPKFWRGATIWTEVETMPFPLASVIEQFSPDKAEVAFKFHLPAMFNPRTFDRYFLENLPSLLDAPNEWYVTTEGPHKGRIFIRLEGNHDPNDTIIEAARHLVFVDIEQQEYITIDGLKLRFFNSVEYSAQVIPRHAGCYSSLFRITGQSNNIKIMNCELSYSSHGISIFPNGNDLILENFEIENNKIYDMEGYAVKVTAGRDLWIYRNNQIINPEGSRVKRIRIRGNDVKNCGFRALSSLHLGGIAVSVRAGELVEVSHNLIDYTYGPGILVYNGDFFDSSGLEYPLIRTSIHHNVVTNSMLAGQDYGGIASWHGGPVYIYNNVSGNSVGYKYAQDKKSTHIDWYRRSSFGPGIYLDQQYKGYVFNNIIWGKNNDENDSVYNSVAFKEAQGFMNTVFNNTIYRCAVGLEKDMSEHNRCFYLNNLFLNIGSGFIVHKPPPSVIEYESLAYTNNVFAGDSKKFGRLGKQEFHSIETWKNFLQKNDALTAQTGETARKQQVKDMRKHLFTPTKNSLAIDRARKVFVPWGLFAVVGEWGFYKHSRDPQRILGEHIYWSQQWKNRYVVNREVPRNDLLGYKIKGNDFKYGILEDWIEGALRFDGKSIYCVAENGDLLDMDTNNFLIEAVLKIDRGEQTGAIVSKVSGNRGYALQLQEQGALRMSLFTNKGHWYRESATPINDGKWHHIVAEIDRQQQEGIRLFIDGELSDGVWFGNMDNNASLTNHSEFFVGKDSSNHKYLSMEIDFLRVSRGTLRDAETDIQELYGWEFNGPFLRDFYGNPPSGKARDIGAIERVGKN